MDFEDQDEHEEEEMDIAAASYDSLPNSGTRLKIPTSTDQMVSTGQRKPKYRECLKNHAVGIGGHAVGVGLGIGEPFLLPHPGNFSPYYRTPTGYLHVAPHHRPLALPSTSGGGGTHSREEQEDMSNPSGGGGGGGGGGSSSFGKKRFRTKFTQEQKDRMLGLAETLVMQC
ncbi:zinc-finger homeodomain protein 1-like [Benincasa hispida]|uniref:zinc-finger homeodomain protein 1-like n=1 Tax=Benincasa hispida TaxID=102211 RepID=UPI0019026104|nr:zinc-finger homeodomain protein 1-like [Benincasa hispida]